ncbi:signal peptide peptidase SppA [Algicella marina]|uniref:Signal peptide peptidase SppA n=1 Tax=Algicella marina TaxID=2683284 RepID=A0A6P1T4I0_9RHOB|nr:signal peptide peptidase SppA [Algicella marina]QHQ36169.1 signal peptide peptidase SppA [Algicella marina]
MNAIERDFYEERRRKWRRSSFLWGFGIAIVLSLIVGAALRLETGQPTGPHIAHVAIRDVIYTDIDREEMLADLRDSDDARALILEIDSPGGTTVGAEILYELLREIAEDRPVVAVMGDVAASGGYITAIAADHIIARGNTITGSIGVIMEYPDVTELLDRVGVQFRTVRSSPLKAEPAPYRETSPEARAVQEAIIADSYAWFRDLVASRRRLQGDGLAAVVDGRILTGRMALQDGLVDALGGPDDALTWLESQDEALKNLPVLSWELPDEDTGPLGIFGRISGIGDSLQRISNQSRPRLLSILN